MPMTRERSSMKINPILKRELKVQSRGYTLLGLICGIDSALFLISILGSLAVISRMRQDYHADYGSLLMIFVLVSMFAFLLILLICPSLTAGSIAGERRSKTLDLLLATRLSPVSIVTGKLLSAFSVVQILIITSIPALMVPLMYGGAGLPEILLTAVGLSCAAFMLLCMGLFVSSAVRSPQRATALSYVLLIGLCAGTVLPGLLFAPFYGGGHQNAAALVLLLNPIVTMASVIFRAVSGAELIALIYGRLGLSLSEGMRNSYILIALLLELLLGFMFLFASVVNISPKKRKQKINSAFAIEKNEAPM